MTPRTSSIKDLRIDRSAGAESSTRWGLVLLVLVVLGGGAGGAAWLLMRPQPITARTAVVREVSAAAPGERTVLNASGYVTARREATVSSKVTGKVADVLIEEGMKVQEGQVLAHLDSTNVLASLALAEAQATSSKAQMEETRVRITEAERELKRESGLISKRVTTQAEYDKAQTEALALRARLRQQLADVDVAERSVASWRQQLEDTVIRAPFAGVVTSKNAQPGEMISPMSSGGFTRTGICTIVDMQSLEIEIDVNESYINRVVPGQAVEATLDAYPDWKIPCKVIAVIPTADRQKSTVKVRVGFDKLDARILPEMSVKVAFRETAVAGSANGDAATTGSRNIIIPRTALFDENGRDIIYVVRENKAERRAVSVASRGADEIVLSAGASAGERVLTERPHGLADGAAVKAVE
jgi:HlyD family secretion protein